jgi:hypothetical protein
MSLWVREVKQGLESFCCPIDFKCADDPYHTQEISMYVLKEGTMILTEFLSLTCMKYISKIAHKAQIIDIDQFRQMIDTGPAFLCCVSIGELLEG